MTTHADAIREALASGDDCELGRLYREHLARMPQPLSPRPPDNPKPLPVWRGGESKEE